jgi:hypothetical protein
MIIISIGTLISKNILLSNLFLAMIMMHISMVVQNFILLMISTILNGFMSLSILAVAFELGVELSYPIGEAMSGGIINSLASTTCLILVEIMTLLLDNGTHMSALCCFVINGILLIISTILVAFAPIKFQRINIEH